MEANVTEDVLSYKTVQRIVCTASLHGEYFFYPLTAVNIVLAITAFLENAVILVALQRKNSLHPPSKLMFQCLAVTDLCVGVIAQPLFIIQFASATHCHFQLCFTVLSINDVVGSCLSGVSLLTLAAISVDRLLALSLGMEYKKTITLKRMRLVLIFIWIFNISVNSLRRFWRYFLISRVTSAVIYSSLVISAFCYFRIYFKLRHHKKIMQENDQQGRQLNEEYLNRPLNIERYRKTVSTALCVQLTMVACYLPYGIVVAMVRHSPSLNIAVRLAISFVFLNSSLNPILYCWKIRGVKLAVKDIIRQLCKSCLTGKSGEDLSG
ncbi:adenosine receptor A3-like [Orbicella faveolata]|uniref:adenosine receptor A3-like n=1 Tax=Orbicella faveolata TaxID=48498 RepID=UPI0009E5E847|nr:adenosine receptor A3-like [Orbicella faveolata]